MQSTIGGSDIQVHGGVTARIQFRNRHDPDAMCQRLHLGVMDLGRSKVMKP